MTGGSSISAYYIACLNQGPDNDIGETGKKYEIKCQNKEDYDDLIMMI